MYRKKYKTLAENFGKVSNNKYLCEEFSFNESLEENKNSNYYSYELWFDGNCIHEDDESEFESKNEALNSALIEVEDRISDEGWSEDDINSFTVKIYFDGSLEDEIDLTDELYKPYKRGRLKEQIQDEALNEDKVEMVPKVDDDRYVDSTDMFW